MKGGGNKEQQGREQEKGHRFAMPFVPRQFVSAGLIELFADACAFVWLLQQGTRFVNGSLCVVVGLHGEAVLLHGAVALAGDVEDLAETDVAPDLRPAWLAIAA